MSKTTKAQRTAFDAIDDAAAAAKQARKVAKTLPGKNAKKLREVAAETLDDVDVSKKAIRRAPAKVTKKAQRAEERVRKATRTAIAKAEKKARLRAEAERAAAEAERAAQEAKARNAEAKSLKKLAAKAERAAAKAELDALAADRTLEEQFAPQGDDVDAAAAAESSEPAPAAEPEPAAEPAPAAAAPATSKPAASKPAAARKRPTATPAAPKPTAARKRPTATATSAAPPTDLAALTVVQLRERARAAGATGYSRLTKAELVALLS